MSCEEGFFGEFEYGECLFVSDARELANKVSEGFTFFEVIKKMSNRHSCSFEDRCTAHLVWIHLDEIFDVRSLMFIAEVILLYLV